MLSEITGLATQSDVDELYDVMSRLEAGVQHAADLDNRDQVNFKCLSGAECSFCSCGKTTGLTEEVNFGIANRTHRSLYSKSAGVGTIW